MRGNPRRFKSSHPHQLCQYFLSISFKIIKIFSIRTSQRQLLWSKNMHENFEKGEEINVSSNRSFGVVFTLVFLAVGAWMIYGGHSEGWLFIAVSIFLFIVTLSCPYILGPLNWAWFKFGLLLGLVMNPLILGFVFFLVVTPMAIMRRLLGKDSLHLKTKPALKSYWVARSPAGPKLNSMTKQF
jgi:hypothetical protein